MVFLKVAFLIQYYDIKRFIFSTKKINLEKSKESLLSELKKIEDEQIELKKELENKYGKISVNLQSGEFEIIPEEAEIVK